MKNNTGIWVVIPNWNGAEFIKDCLKSLEKQTQKHQVIVVDNGSVDNSVELISKNFPTVKLLQNKENLGFAGGVNFGIKYAMRQGARYVALLNNDATADLSWLKNLVKAADSNDKVAVVTGKLLRSDGCSIDSTGECFAVGGFPFPRGRDENDNGQYDKEGYVFGASGGASLYNIAAFKEVGLFDEKYFAYYEDTDISFRFQLAGWKVLYDPSAIAFHEISATSSRLSNFTRYHATKNFYLLYLKNMPLPLLLLYLPLFLLKAVTLMLSSTVKLKLHVWLKGLLSFLVLLPSVLRDRQKIQRNRKVSLGYVNSLLSLRLL